MTNDKLTGKLLHWAFILQEYEFKVIHRPGITHQNTNTMSWRPLITFEDLSEARRDFSRIPTIHVSYASNYLVLLQCNLVKYPIVDIWKDLDTMRFFQHGEYPPQVTSSQRERIQQWSKRYSWRDITLSNAYHKVTEWFFHHMNGLVLFKRYTRSLDTLELNIFIAFSLLITIGKVCMLKTKMSLLGVNNVIEWELPSLFDNSRFLHSLFRACSIAGHVI
jgi:hypothetical protein